MHKASMTVGAGIVLALSGPASAQSTTTAEPPSCAEILATPSASAAEIAELNDTTVVRVQECRDADNSAGTAPGVADLRTAVAANRTIAPNLTAAGVAADRVVAVRRDENGGFAFFVIGAFR